MAIYPTSDTDLRVPPARLIFVVRAVFVRCGMSDEDAALLAESLVRADLRGVHSHGVLRVPDYVNKLTKEGVDPRGRPRIVSERAGAIVVDGDNSMGQISGSFAMKRAIEKARKNGGRDRRRAGVKSLRRDGLVHDDGREGEHDRSCRHQRAADDGALGRDGQDYRHQSFVDRNAGRKTSSLRS